MKSLEVSEQEVKQSCFYLYSKLTMEINLLGHAT